MSRLTLAQKAALMVVAAMSLTAIFYPVITPLDPSNFSFDPLERPGRTHLLGTNSMGQDNLAGLLAGFRLSLGISLATALTTTAVGLLLAVVSSYYGGWVDQLILRLTELFLIVPETIVIMIFATFAGPRVLDIILVMSLFSWSRVTRVLRAKALIAVHRESVQYTLMLKGNVLDIGRKLWRELYPAVTTVFVQQCSRAAVYEATVAFLGVGDPTLKSWGRTIKAALDYEGIFRDGVYQWWLLPPMICLIGFILALGMLTFERE